MSSRSLLLALAAMAVGMTACSTMTSAEKAAYQARVAQQVRSALDARRYEITPNIMYPHRGPAKTLTSEWSLEMRGDTIVSYLPYVGQAFSIPYGGGKGLNFTAPVISYDTTTGRKGQDIITIKTNNGEEPLEYRLEVYDNGNANIDVRARERDPISYSGTMELEE